MWCVVCGGEERERDNADYSPGLCRVVWLLSDRVLFNGGSCLVGGAEGAEGAIVGKGERNR